MVSYHGGTSAAQSTDQIFAKLNTCLGNQCQSAVKCGICCSTLREAWLPSCNHPFCKECITQCFRLKTKIECPICRQIISKRGCVASPYIDQIVKLYLQVASRFKNEIHGRVTVKLPDERRFLESQAFTQTESPLRDFKAPTFVVPAERKRKSTDGAERPVKRAKESVSEEVKLQSRRDTIMKIREKHREKRGLDVLMEEKDEDEELKALAEKRAREAEEEKRKEASPAVAFPENASSSISASPKSRFIPPTLPPKRQITKETNTERTQSVDTETQSDLISTADQLENLLKDTKRNRPELSSVAALFHALPWIKQMLRENANDLLKEIPELSRRNGDRESEADEDVFKEEEEEEENLVPPAVRLGTQHARSRETGTTGDCVPPTPSKSDELVLDDDDKKDKENVKEEVEDEEGFELAKGVKTPNGGNKVQVLRADEASQGQSSQRSTLEGAKILNPSDRGKIVISVSRVHSFEDQQVIQKFGELFPDVTLTEEVEEGCTHLVMMNTDYDGISKTRSLKYVFAIARKCHIITKQWMEACIDRKEVVDWDKYNVWNDRDETRVTPWMKAQEATVRLLEGKKFFVPKEYCESKVVPRAKVVELIELCGGQVVNKIWEVHEDCFILFAPGSKEIGDARRFEQDTKAPVVSVDFLLDNIAEYKTTPWKVAGHRICKGRRSGVASSA